MSALSNSNGGVGPPLWLNHKWAFTYTDTAGSFASAEVDVYLDKVGASPVDRVTLTDASSGVTRATTSITVSQTPTWVAAELSEGTWEVHLLIDKSQVAWWRFQVLTPEAGAFTP